MKKFDRELYEENDTQFRHKVVDYLKAEGFNVHSNEDPYGIDLIIELGVEIERRPSWRGPEFPYDTVHIPLRKKKFFLHNGSYMILNKEADRALSIDVQDIIKNPLVEVPNKYLPEGELFYNIPIEQFTWLNLDVAGL